MGLLDRFTKKTDATTAPPAAAPHAQSTAAPTQTRPAGGGVDLTKRAPGLVDLNKKAKLSLAKNNLTGVQAAVYLVLDHSGSMSSYYRDGTVQGFTEAVLAAAVEFDDDGSIPVILFDSKAHAPVEVSVDDYQGSVDRAKAAAGHMGTTDYAAAMQAVINHYQASGSTAPALVVFETDGSPNSRAAAEKVLCQAASLPIFWQFVGFGSDRFEFLRKLDELAVPKRRVVDNAGFFAAGVDPAAMPAQVLYDNLMQEFPDWLKTARAAGILTN